ncbi:His-Xaa-Ser repeat protein HxsA, partial [Vibrio anguillarum]|nr:His-Xaa-Ser repeat protein HxsA [Vibrio anguillarum]
MKRKFNLAALLPGFFAVSAGANTSSNTSENIDIIDELSLNNIVLAP